MNDKERLEMIKHDLEERGQYGGFIDDYDTLWLIEQAEKAEVVREEIKGKWSTEMISVHRLWNILNK